MVTGHSSYSHSTFVKLFIAATGKLGLRRQLQATKGKSFRPQSCPLQP